MLGDRRGQHRQQGMASSAFERYERLHGLDEERARRDDQPALARPVLGLRLKALARERARRVAACAPGTMVCRSNCDDEAVGRAVLWQK